MEEDLRKMMTPYDLYCNPYTGYLYATDADNYASAGKLYQWTPEGRLNGVFTTYINPGHILAIPTLESGVDEIFDVSAAESDCQIYDLSGRKVSALHKGNIYIVNGKKILVKSRLIHWILKIDLQNVIIDSRFADSK